MFEVSCMIIDCMHNFSSVLDTFEFSEIICNFPKHIHVNKILNSKCIWIFLLVFIRILSFLATSKLEIVAFLPK